MMDLPIPSSVSNEALLFEAFTERIPPRGTKVRLLLRLKDRAEKKPADEPPASGESPGEPPASGESPGEPTASGESP
jgi:hypothetical protein